MRGLLGLLPCTSCAHEAGPPRPCLPWAAHVNRSPHHLLAKSWYSRQDRAARSHPRLGVPTLAGKEGAAEGMGTRNAAQATCRPAGAWGRTQSHRALAAGSAEGPKVWGVTSREPPPPTAPAPTHPPQALCPPLCRLSASCSRHPARPQTSRHSAWHWALMSPPASQCWSTRHAFLTWKRLKLPVPAHPDRVRLQSPQEPGASGCDRPWKWVFADRIS